MRWFCPSPTTEILLRLSRIEESLFRLTVVRNPSEDTNAYQFLTLEDIMSALSDLTDEVAAVKGVTASALTLIQGLKDQIAALIAGGQGATDAQLQALHDDLVANEQPLADAVAATPPAETTPPPAA